MAQWTLLVSATAVWISSLAAQEAVVPSSGAATLAPPPLPVAPCVPSPLETALARVRTVVETLASSDPVRSGTVGFFLRPLPEESAEFTASVEQKGVVSPLEINADQSFIPASTLKTLTTGVALYTLGPDYRFQTRLYHEWETGNLIIRGGGDPSLGRLEADATSIFEAWTRGIEKEGSGDILGSVVADESEWESQEVPDGWTWQDMGNYFAPVLTPLCFLNNEFHVWFDVPEKVGNRVPMVEMEPWLHELGILSELRSGKPGTGDQAYFYGAPGSATYVARGTLGADLGVTRVRAALPDPALYCAQQFTWHLRNRGINVSGEATTSRRQTLAGEAPPVFAACGHLLTTRSAPLAEMLVPINHHSLNLDTECLCRTLGHGSTARGAKAVQTYLAEHGLPLRGVELSDGSGLSRLNMVTPRLLTEAVAHFSTGAHGDVFLASLPVAGHEGTLRRVGLGTPAAGRIRAKSGSQMLHRPGGAPCRWGARMGIRVDDQQLLRHLRADPRWHKRPLRRSRQPARAAVSRRMKALFDKSRKKCELRLATDVIPAISSVPSASFGWPITGK
jgi:serine-type D-Ala-D-Ala carboxypeptidase/endopeptidase (penicillin-binding protein 4)